MSDSDFEFFKSVNEKTIDAASMVLRTLVLVHGGASIALLAFIGNLAGKSPLLSPEKINNLAMTLVWFGWGIVFAVVAMALAYLTNYLTLAHANASASGRIHSYDLGKALCHIASVVAVFSSLGLFIIGMYDVRNAVIGIWR